MRKKGQGQGVSSVVVPAAGSSSEISANARYLPCDRCLNGKELLITNCNCGYWRGGGIDGNERRLRDVGWECCVYAVSRSRRGGGGGFCRAVIEMI